MDVALTLMNESDVAQGTHIVVFQKNLCKQQDTTPDDPVAWRVFSLEKSASKKFHISKHLSVAVADTKGAICDQHLTDYGQHWQVMHSKSRDRMIPLGQAVDPELIEVQNALKSTVNAQIYKDGLLLASHPGLKPNETASFTFDKTIWVGLTNEPVREGTSLTAALMRQFSAQVSLEGLSKAKLVLTGHGEISDQNYRLTLVTESQEAVNN